MKVRVKYVRPNNSLGKVRSNYFLPATSFYKSFNLKRSLLAICILTILLVTGYTANAYNGDIYIFLLFSATSNFLLLFGFRGKAFFFDTFIGVFLWIAFWLKLVLGIAVVGSSIVGISESVTVLDDSLLVSSVAFLALIIASYLKEFILYKNHHVNDKGNGAMFFLYKEHRKYILIFYVLLFVFIAVTNSIFHIYQKGIVTPPGVSSVANVYKLLLLFGLSSFGALILRYELDLKSKTTFFAPLLVIVEAFFTNVSLLSRAFIMNIASLGFGFLKHLQLNKIKLKLNFLIVITFVGLVAFIGSVLVVNSLRLQFSGGNSLTVTEHAESVSNLVLTRLVGLEGVVAVSRHPEIGFELFSASLDEKYDEHSMSFYDKNFIDSPYTGLYERIKDNNNINHYSSLPGFIAFFYYSGSMCFVFLMTFVFGFIAVFIEWLAYNLSSRNVIFSSLIAQTIAYRYIHFGYAPLNSYKLFGAIIFTIFSLYIIEKVLGCWYKNV
jgi:hypothetical protein